MEKRTWAEINLDALEHNIREIRKITNPNAQIMAVVKADAYGHGFEISVREFSACGCKRFAVSNLEEALQVRELSPDCSILILGYTPPEYAETLAVNNISQAVFNSEYAARLSDEAKKKGKKKDKKLPL